MKKVRTTGADHRELTVRQVEVLQLLSKGLTNKEIAEVLSIKPNTVKIHTSKIFEALDVSTRAEAVGMAHAFLGHESIRALEAAQQPTIAVLPFYSAALPEAQRHLPSCFLNEVITRLGSGWFPVVSRFHADAAASAHPTLIAVGSRVGARYLIDGTLELEGPGGRATARLVDALSGQQLWSRPFEWHGSATRAALNQVAAQIAVHVSARLLRIEHVIRR